MQDNNLFSERELFILSKWREGADIRSKERVIKEVAASGVSLTVVCSNSFVRLLLYEVAFHWGLTVRAHTLRTWESGGPWHASRQVKMVQIHISRPDSYALPRRTLMEMRNDYARVHNEPHRIKEGQRDHVVELEKFAEIPPLSPDDPVCHFLRLPKDMICFLMAILPLRSLSMLARCSKLLYECSKRGDVWRCQTERFLSEEPTNARVFKNLGAHDDRLAKEAKQLLKELVVLAGSVEVPWGTCQCINWQHAHGRAFDQKSKLVQPKRKN